MTAAQFIQGCLWVPPIFAVGGGVFLGIGSVLLKPTGKFAVGDISTILIGIPIGLALYAGYFLAPFLHGRPTWGWAFSLMAVPAMVVLAIILADCSMRNAFILRQVPRTNRRPRPTLLLALFLLMIYVAPPLLMLVRP